MTSPRISRAAADSRWRSPKLHTLLAGIFVFILQWVHGPAEGFLYDAVQYWGAPLALLTDGNVSEVGVLGIRGALTSLVYLAPAMVTSVLGPWSAVWTVLAWNALLAAVLLVVLLPGIAEHLVPGRWIPRVWTSAILGGIVISGFARFPLLDVWSGAIALVGLYALMAGRRWWAIAAGGLALAVAVNLRPSYLVPVAIAALVLLIARPRRTAWAVPGALLGAAPQVVFNLAAFGQLSASPVHTPFLLRVQAAQAAFAVRYDTVAFTDRHPQQWYCDPGYAALLVGDPEPTGPLAVVGSALHHLPQSLWFLSQKASASLHWSFATPYEPGPETGASPMTFIVVAIAAIGIVALIWRVIANWRSREARFNALALLGFWFGALGTLVFSTPETRFALPLILVGLIGLLIVPPAAPLHPGTRRSAIVALAAAAALTAALLLIGEAGLDHPLPPGPLPDASACAASASLTAP